MRARRVRIYTVLLVWFATTFGPLLWPLLIATMIPYILYLHEKDSFDVVKVMLSSSVEVRTMSLLVKLPAQTLHGMETSYQLSR